MSDNDLIRRGEAMEALDWGDIYGRNAQSAIAALPAVTVGMLSNERAHLLHTLSEALDAAEGGEFQTVEIYVSDARRLFKVLDDLRGSENRE
jgi:hypothetical protein